MERDERYEISSQGSLVVGIPTTLTPSEKKKMIEKMFSINGWTYTLLEEITSAHFYIELKNENLEITKKFHLFHGNVRKEDPDRNREEKKIQLGTENDPRQYPDDAIILGFYVYENKEDLSDVVVVAWPIEANKNYPANPSLRVNMKTDILPAKNAGYYVDKSTGKNLVAFRPEFIYHYLECYKDIHYGLTVSKETAVDNESLFRSWFLKQRKDNGEVYSDSTRSQYIGALKAVSNAFPDAIAPFSSVFEINDAEAFERASSAIKADPGFEEFNKSRGNGSLSAGLDLYKRFLLEKDEDTSNMFTPEWFQEKAAEYPTLDSEANALLEDFQQKFAPEYLASLSGIEMLNTIFLNATNTENLCRVLEFGAQIKDMFGSIKGGNAYKYGLYYSTQGQWMTGSHQKPRQLTEEEAIEVGAKLRDHLVDGAKAIKVYGTLSSLEDYKKLHQTLTEVTEGDIERVWFLKYYQMLYPELFATNYSDYAQRTVLGAIGEEKEKYALVRMGQIRFYANKCGISNVMFNKIFWEYYSEDTVTAKAEPSQDICHKTGYQSEYARNRILFGAPGTGKSFTLNKEKDKLLAEGGEYERVTFHPDYSYANFVGTYKPVPCKDDQGHDAITYSYVPGPFMRTYVKALLNSRTDSPKPYLLVIEEINRANVAAVFGDVFQLLDRDDDEVSEYAIQASEDIKKYLAEKLGGDPEEYAEIRIPDNMFIWATMNSADQGVFPMDTAFKRRWDFTYLGIDDSEKGIEGKKVVLGEGQYKRVVEWNKLRKAINEELLTYKVNEDKLMGPYFISKKNLPEGDTIDAESFTRIFKNKVIMYLFDDAAKQKRISLFGGCDEKSKSQYSKICSEFDKKGVYIFCEAISNQFIDNVPQEETAEGDAE